MAAPAGPGTPGQDPNLGGGYGQPAGAPGTQAYPPQGQHGYGQQGLQGGGGGQGFGDRASQAADRVARHVKTPETKEFFKTSEFIVWALTVAGILIAGLSVSEGDGSDFAAAQVWLYVTLASFAYIISRGIAKAGTRRGYGDAPMDRGGNGY